MFARTFPDQHSRRKIAPSRHATVPVSGFTLVELLVALGLVALLMLLFAEVFQIATGTMSTQRGVMENDQRARTLETVLTNDLKNRSMGSVIAFLPNEPDPAGNGNPLNLPLPVYQFGNTNREGFLSISENNPNADDDVLHFTVFLQNAAEEPYYGRTAQLASPIVPNNPNQPEFDDGQAVPNATATSRSAEIVYFVRNGNLYRRVLLIRQPVDGSFDAQPRTGTTGLGADMLNPANGFYSATGPFWRDFDFSARYDTTLGYAQFLGAGGTASPLNNVAAGAYPAAIPLNRFGHDPDTSNINPSGGGSNASVGNPREFVFGTPATAGSPPAGNKNTHFIGRFTQEETSHPDFRFPQSPSTVGNPMDQDVQLTLNAAGVVTQFSGNATNSRRGEDILLTNVHGFDVKVWDELYVDYVDIGHDLSNAGSGPSGREGDFNQLRNRRPTYGPQATATNRMFDTWHPNFNANAVGGVTSDDAPPFVPKYGYPTSPTAASPTPKGHLYVAGTAYVVGDIVVPVTGATEYIAYRLIGPSGGGTSTGEPNWTAAPQVGNSFTDVDGLTWTAIPNIKRLKSLKITVRYLDPTSDQMRQVTLIQSLLD